MQKFVNTSYSFPNMYEQEEEGVGNNKKRERVKIRTV